MKRELESYGVSTITFLEKSEYVAALEEARAAGMTSVNTNKSKKKKKKRSPSSSTESSATNQSRGELISAELEKLKTMKATEMKKELEERGISTKSFFEKSEFMMALADARVDGVTKVAGGGGGKSSGGEGYAEYKADDVEVITNDSAGPRKRSQQEEGQGQQVGNPFGGGGMPGGMGGMGGIADMLKNMGMDGAGGGGDFWSKPIRRQGWFHTIRRCQPFFRRDGWWNGRRVWQGSRDDEKPQVNGTGEQSPVESQDNGCND